MTVLTAAAIAEIEAREILVRQLQEALAAHKVMLGEALDREVELKARLATLEARP